MNRTTIAAAAVACLLAAETSPVAQDWRAWLDERATATGFSGVVLVAPDDRLEALAAYGQADRARQIAITPDTRFNLGSITKTLTAIAIAQLIQAGRVALDDPIAKWLPDHPTLARITVKDLVTHRAGIGPFMNADFGTGSLAAMAARVAAEPLAFDPGSRQAYSNGGYILLGRLVEVASGQPYEAYVQERIYAPAGMTQTAWNDPRTPEFALGYPGAKPGMGPSGQAAREPRRGNPAGGSYATARDLFNFARALRGGRLLDAAMTRTVLHDTFSGASGAPFGFAMREQTIGGRRFIGNGGGAPGVNAEFRLDPSGDAIVVVLSNTSPPSATSMLTAVLERLTTAAAPAVATAATGAAAPQP